MAALPTAPSHPNRPQLLLIDDDPLVARAFARTLRARYHVTATTSAREALRAIAAGASFDAILCDLNMDEMSGYEFHDHLRRLDSAHVHRLITMSADISDDDELPHIMKPISLEQVTRTLEGLAEAG